MAQDGDQFLDEADGLLVDAGLDIRKLPGPVQAAGKALLGTLAERITDGDVSSGVQAIAERYGGPRGR
jgi:hypothetical protein